MVTTMDAPQGVRMVPRHTLEVCEGMTLAQAIANADALGGDQIILLYTDVYTEGELTPNGGANITIKGMGEGRVEIAPTALPATATIVSGHTLSLENVIIRAFSNAVPAVLVNGGTLTLETCHIYGVGTGDSIVMTDGQINANRTTVHIGNIDLSTNACILNMYYCRIVTDPIDTAGALVHQITLVKCDLNNQNVASAATGGTIVTIIGCSHVNTVTNAGTGAFTIRGSDVQTVTASSTGTITIFGGNLNACGGATASVTWKTHGQQYEVIAGMVIGHAITAAVADTPAPAATAPYTILIHPGIYDEQVSMSAWVNLKGVGPRGSVVIVNSSHVIETNDNIQISDLTVRLDNPGATQACVRDGGANDTGVRLTNLVFELTNIGAANASVIYMQGASDYTVERCYLNTTPAAAARIFTLAGSTPTLRLIDNDFTVNHVGSQMFFVSVAATVVSEGNRWDGAGRFIAVTNGTFTFDNDTILNTGAWGNTGATMTFTNCRIVPTVYAGNTATVRLSNCHYRAISRVGTGNIVDESPWLSDAPWHVERWDWQAALASAQVGVRGTPTDAGSGQVLLEVNPVGAADAEAVETNPEVAGSLANEFTPARTPRFLTQIAVDNFHADATMFFGLRQTLGDAVPLAAEHHAGFAWDNLDATVNKFWAISSDGAQQITLLTTPTVNVQVQLEVIVFGGVTTVGWVEFRIDGALVATHPTRIPVNGLDWQHLLATAGGGADVDIDVTVRPGGCQECPS